MARKGDGREEDKRAGRYSERDILDASCIYMCVCAWISVHNQFPCSVIWYFLESKKIQDGDDNRGWDLREPRKQ